MTSSSGKKCNIFLEWIAGICPFIATTQASYRKIGNKWLRPQSLLWVSKTFSDTAGLVGMFNKGWGAIKACCRNKNSFRFL